MGFADLLFSLRGLIVRDSSWRSGSDHPVSQETFHTHLPTRDKTQMSCSEQSYCANQVDMDKFLKPGVQHSKAGYYLHP